MESQFATIKGIKIHYKLGGVEGSSPLLLLHGAVGSTNDFSQQLEGQSSLTKYDFRLVALDLPGYGQSSLENEIDSNLPIKVGPNLEYYEFCAEVGAELMSHLNFKTYSIAGWSDGSRVACLLAAQFQSRVDALLIWGFVPTLDKLSSEAIAKTRDTSTWNPMALEHYTTVYGEERFSEMWRNYVDSVVKSLELPPTLDITKRLRDIKCPTMILHGSEDPLVSYRHHVGPLQMQIFDLQIKQLPGLAHNLHQAHPVKFNQLVTNFVAGARC